MYVRGRLCMQRYDSGRTSRTRTGKVIGSKRGRFTPKGNGQQLCASTDTPLDEQNDERWEDMRSKRVRSSSTRQGGCHLQARKANKETDELMIGTRKAPPTKFLPMMGEKGRHVPVKVPPQRKSPPPVKHVLAVWKLPLSAEESVVIEYRLGPQPKDSQLPVNQEPEEEVCKVYRVIEEISAEAYGVLGMDKITIPTKMITFLIFFFSELRTSDKYRS